MENSVAYTGTHDNETVIGWLDAITQEEQKMVRDYLYDMHTPKKQLHMPFIAAAMRSNAKYCIVPMQDWLGLDNSCRMNKPSTIGTNWRWRITQEQLNDALRTEMHEAARRYGRLNWDNEPEETETTADKAEK